MAQSKRMRKAFIETVARRSRGSKTRPAISCRCWKTKDTNQKIQSGNGKRGMGKMLKGQRPNSLTTSPSRYLFPTLLDSPVAAGIESRSRKRDLWVGDP